MTIAIETANMACGVTFPPSPSLSVDYLDDLDDEALEAYLAGKGALSQWPTPPLKDCVLIEQFEIGPETALSLIHI